MSLEPQPDNALPASKPGTSSLEATKTPELVVSDIESGAPARLVTPATSNHGSAGVASSDAPLNAASAVTSDAIAQPPVTTESQTNAPQSSENTMHDSNPTSSAATGEPEPKKRDATPTYGIDIKLTKEQINSLLEKVGDHSVPEHEWIRACHLLGDYKHTPPAVRRKNRATRAGVAMLATGLLAIALNWGTIATIFAPPSAPPPPPIQDWDKVYMAKLQKKIKHNWFPPKSTVSRSTVSMFSLNPDGSIENLRVFTSSGDLKIDNAALESINNSAPFEPLPPGITTAQDIQFTHDYNVPEWSNSPSERASR